MKVNNQPVVGIVMGSDSDYELVQACTKVLSTFEVPFEVHVISAHRDTESCLRYAKEAKEKGLELIIAFAGMAAHLGGVIAANTRCPVIGVPLNRTGLGGMDALLSTVQMPPGIPVATVAIDGSANAAHLAVRILALHDKQLEEKLIMFQSNLKVEMKKKSQQIQERMKNESTNH
jgi:phosphoribosylaminoimidazole carboxylase PurE protein